MAGFIPPFDLGQFTPSASAISSWLYQIWKYLQENPITSTEQIQSEIGEAVGEIVPGAVEDYMEEHPVQAPVLSVNGMIGAVVLAYNNLVGSGSTLPVYRATSSEITNQDLLDAWDEGCRFALVDDTTPYMMARNENTINLISLAGGGGGGGGAVDSVNGRTGAVVLTYTDFVGTSSTIPVLYAANDEISNADLLTAWGNGYRFVIVDDVYPYIMLKDGQTITLISIANSVTSVNGKTGTVTLSYIDFVPDDSTIPIYFAQTMPADLATVWAAGYRFMRIAANTYILQKSGSTVTALLMGGGAVTVWENPSPLAEFAAQNVSLGADLTQYQFILLTAMHANNNAQNIATIYSVLLPGYVTASAFDISFPDNHGAQRRFTLTTSNGETVAGFAIAQINNSTNNTYLIPQAIFGISL